VLPPRVASNPLATAVEAAAKADVATVFAGMSNEARVLAVLDALDGALPVAVETMLRDELGDMWWETRGDSTPS
jgi:hypothetical protein